MYKLFPKRWDGSSVNAVMRLSDNACIPFDPANTDYQNFKAQILDSSATLEDATGTAMTAQAAIDFVNTLP